MKLNSLALALLPLLALCQNLYAQGTAFTYQGRLNSAGSTVTGSYDFQFIAYDSSIGGNQQGVIVTTNGVPVSNGLFTVTLDFGSVFTGAARWLDIAVRTNGGTSYTVLSPRQNLTPIPYAIFAANAGTAATAATASSFSGALAGDVTGTQGGTAVAKVGGQTAANVATAVLNANAATSASTGSTIVKRDASGNFSAGTVTATGFSGNGASLTGLSAANVGSGTLADARLSGNVPLLNASNGFTGKLLVNGSSAGDYSTPLAQVINNNVSGSTAPALRAIGFGTSPNGVLSVSSSGTGLLAQFGNASGFVADITTNGTIDAASANLTGLSVNPGAGAVAVINDGAQTAGILATGGPNPGYIRLRNALQIFPNQAQTAAGLLDLRNTSGAATISLSGANGNVSASSVTAPNFNGGLGSDFFLNDHALRLRNDPNHGLGYNGAGVTNFPSGSVLPDGPVLWGFGGGALGVLNGGAKSALSWDNSGVTVAGNLSANNTPGINYSQVISEVITIPNNAAVTIASEGNAKVAPGFFFITANVSGFGTGHQMQLSLLDVSGAPVLLTACGTETVTANSSSGKFNLSLSWVVPIAAANGYQNFAIEVKSFGNSGSAAEVDSHNLSVVFIPRQNN